MYIAFYSQFNCFNQKFILKINHIHEIKKAASEMQLFNI